jgi:DNA-binding XRE family transcriptional regulator
MANDSSIADRFREIRAKSGLKQKDFAQSLGASHSVISDIERGDREPSRKIMQGLAELYGVDLNWLLVGTVANKDSSQIQKRNSEIEKLTAEMDELKKSIDQLERENKELSKELLDRMRQLLGAKADLKNSSA